MKRIFVPTQSGTDWQKLLAKPRLHWKAGKSAMTIASSWEAAHNSLPPEITSALDASGDTRLVGLHLLAAFPEYQVELPGGITASQTDVLAIARNTSGLVVLAVEGKVEEEFGPTLGVKRSQISDGQNDRLSFLHKTIGLKQPLPDDIRYQLLHRTASAVLVARDFHAPTAVMIVQSFSENNSWFDDYERFCQQLGIFAVIGKAIAVPRLTNPSLFLAWCQGEQRFRNIDLSSAV